MRILIFVLLRQELGMHILQILDEILLVLSITLVNILHDIKNTIYVESILFNGFEEVSYAIIHFFVDVFIFSLTTCRNWRQLSFSLIRSSRWIAWILLILFLRCLVLCILWVFHRLRLLLLVIMWLLILLVLDSHFRLCNFLLLIIGVAILFEKVFNSVLENGKIFLF